MKVMQTTCFKWYFVVALLCLSSGSEKKMIKFYNIIHKILYTRFRTISVFSEITSSCDHNIIKYFITLSSEPYDKRKKKTHKPLYVVNSRSAAFLLPQPADTNSFGFFTRTHTQHKLARDVHILLT